MRRRADDRHFDTGRQRVQQADDAVLEKTDVRSPEADPVIHQHLDFCGPVHCLHLDHSGFGAVLLDLHVSRLQRSHGRSGDVDDAGEEGELFLRVNERRRDAQEEADDQEEFQSHMDPSSVTAGRAVRQSGSLRPFLPQRKARNAILLAADSVNQSLSVNRSGLFVLH